MGIPDHVTCLLRNLHAGQEATVRIRHGTVVWCQTGKEVCRGCIFSDKQNIFIQISKSYMNIKSKKKKHGIMKKKLMYLTYCLYIFVLVLSLFRVSNFLQLNGLQPTRLLCP